MTALQETRPLDAADRPVVRPADGTRRSAPTRTAGAGTMLGTVAGALVGVVTLGGLGLVLGVAAGLALGVLADNHRG